MLNKNKSTFKQRKNTKTALKRVLQNLYTYPQSLMQQLLNLYINKLKGRTSEKLLMLLFLVIPWNLGKHFEISASYVEGTLISYLIPTLYLQDILVLFVVSMYLFSKVFTRFREEQGSSLLLNDRYFKHTLQKVCNRSVFLFVFSCLLSVFFSGRPLPSIYFLCRIVLYYLFFTISWGLFKRKIVRQFFYTALATNLVLLSLLSFGQFFKQASVFKNYLYFGEQPYNIYTPYIAKESYGGVTKIPPYGTFAHPNILAGYLVICLTIMFGYFLLSKSKLRVLRVGSFFIFSIGLYSLILTKSTTGLIAIVFGLVFLIGYRFTLWLGLYSRLDANLSESSICYHSVHNPIYQKLVVFIGVCIVALGLAFPLLKSFTLNILPTDSTLSVLSVDRRASLLVASYYMFFEKPTFGWGLNSFTYSSQKYYVDSVFTHFYQPVHNIFALILVETGIFGLIFFLALVFYALYQSSCYRNPTYSVVLLQIIFLSSFDHYFFTIHQTLLLFVLTLMFVLTYTE